MALKRSTLLKATIFATGFSGVVAEYILSTLATYFLGDSIFQWIMIISLMLFAMGLGSRISKVFSHKLLLTFLFIEFILSLLVSFSPLVVYTISAYSGALGVIIYAMAITIGLLIGMEIPLVIRINNEFEELRYNISNILENDYYGSLLGGVFFAFLGLPYLGLIYTPFLLGLINFLVALTLIISLWSFFNPDIRKVLVPSGVVVLFMLVGGFFIAKPLVLHGEQKKYQDKIVYSEQTPYQRIIITQWKDDYWLYLNGNQQLCTRDEVMYHEPLVHPAMRLHPYPQNVLVLGGGDGCAVREVLKYPSVELVHLVDMDKAMTDLGKEHPVLKEINNNSLHHDKVKIINDDAYTWVNNSDMHYDVIIIDLPDPRSVELGRLYTFEFYRTCYRMLRPHGIVVTQAGSPYFATRAFLCVEKTMKKAGFNTAPIHNQVVTMGEWGWIIGQKSKTGNDDVVERLKNLHFKDIDTKWINNEAMGLITSFGKDIYLWDKKEVEINRIHHPVLYKYYLKGNWDLY